MKLDSACVLLKEISIGLHVPAKLEVYVDGAAWLFVPVEHLPKGGIGTVTEEAVKRGAKVYENDNQELVIS